VILFYFLCFLFEFHKFVIRCTKIQEMSTSPLPKIEIVLNDEARKFDCSFYSSLESAFEALEAFVADSYSLNSNNCFKMQYEDEDNDLVTISLFEDFKEAIEDSNQKNEILKIHILLQSNVAQQLKSDDLKIDGTEDMLDGKASVDDDGTKNDDLKGDVLHDLRNNKVFREEMISFVTMALKLFQKNHNNEDFDVETCIMSALSFHDTLMNHESLQQHITNLLPLIVPKIEHFSAFLMSIDPSMIGAWINQIIANEDNSFQQPRHFSPFHGIISSLLQARPTFKERNGDKENPIISSTINNNSNDGKEETQYSSSHPTFDFGSLLATLLTPPHNFSDYNSRANNRNHWNPCHNNTHPFFAPPFFNGQQWQQHQNNDNKDDCTDNKNDIEAFEDHNGNESKLSGDVDCASNNKENKDQNDQIDQIDPYSKQLQLLLEMGFTNTELLRNLLTSHNGLIDNVVNVLSS